MSKESVQSNNGLEVYSTTSALVPSTKHFFYSKTTKRLSKILKLTVLCAFTGMGSATTGRRWFSGTGRATRRPSLPNGQASGSLHPLLSLLAIYGRYACFRKMEMQGKLYKQLPSYERSNKTSKLQKFLIEQANCQGTVTFSVCSDAPKVID